MLGAATGDVLEAPSVSVQEGPLSEFLAEMCTDGPATFPDVEQRYTDWTAEVLSQSVPALGTAFRRCCVHFLGANLCQRQVGVSQYCAAETGQVDLSLWRNL